MATAISSLSLSQSKDEENLPAAPAATAAAAAAQPEPALAPPQTATSALQPRFLIIGAGSRGRAYGRITNNNTSGIVAAVAEPIASKRQAFGRTYIWGGGQPQEGESFTDWRDFVAYETRRRERAASGEMDVPGGVDAVFVCVLDEQHRDVVVGLAPLGLHVMCEKPLATTLADCLAIYKAIGPPRGEKPRTVFSIGHVLRYSPHNMLLRKLLLEDRVAGDVLSVEHTEPIGWWHFAHSYVRGNWRSERTSAPSLLTKSCHDIDLLMWLLCSPVRAGEGTPHLPAAVASTGALQYFRRERKPAAAGAATNCLVCPLGDGGCRYSAKNIYLGPQLQGLASGHRGWPVNIVVPEIEDLATMDEKRAAVTAQLAADYPAGTPRDTVAARNWFGRCVFEADNDVNDEQVVSLSWDAAPGRPPKSAVFHMVAHTGKVCQRYSAVYGDAGEVFADSQTITVHDFATGRETVYRPTVEDAGHGGGDLGLTRQFVAAVDKVKNHGWEAERAQNEIIACTLEEAVRSHAVVFAAEAARREKRVVDWDEWWAKEVEPVLGM